MKDVDFRGRPWPPYLVELMNRPGVLRGRAHIRRAMAAQDRQWGDTLAEHQNLAEAQRLEGKANAKDLEQKSGLEEDS